jgi:hypothetical protein
MTIQEMTIQEMTVNGTGLPDHFWKLWILEPLFVNPPIHASFV